MQGCRLTANEIACRRGDRLLLRALSFTLEPGEALHLTGSNGIGKTSLIRILAGLATPYAGTVERIGAAGLVDERAAFDGELPLGRALAFWFGIDRTVERAGVMAALELDRLADVPVRFLSTGQRKRATIARLVGQRAPIWFMDEPLSGLDVMSRARIDALIAEHCADGGIAVIASHQPFEQLQVRTLALEDYAP